MKAILTLALAAAALIGFTSEAEAGSSPFYTGHVWGHSHHGNCAPRVYKIRTIEICRRHECRTAYYPCGRPYTYSVTIVTYRDIFSNGSSRTYTRVLG